MKRLFFSLVLILGFTTSIQAQDQYFVWGDTLGTYDGSPKFVNFQVPAGAAVDSIVVSLYSRGEIDIDTVRWQGGISPVAPNANASKVVKISEATARFEAISSKALIVDLADGATAYNDSVAIIKGYDVASYNTFRFYVVTGTTGNDKTDTNQGFGLYFAVYRRNN
jgi:hypothetical protein